MSTHWDNLHLLVEELSEPEGPELEEGAFGNFMRALKHAILGKDRIQARKDRAHQKSQDRDGYRHWKSKRSHTLTLSRFAHPTRTRTAHKVEPRKKQRTALRHHKKTKVGEALSLRDILRTKRALRRGQK